MKEQIEDMAFDLCLIDGCKHLPREECHNTTCAHCEAEALYNARYRKIPENIGDFSDGYHTFNELYHHRAVLFSVLCNMMPEKAWKSKLHDTGDMFDGMFIVGIETEQGQATYHYDVEPYWDMFKVKELEKAPKWDGHSPADAIQRIGNVSSKGYRKQSDNVIELFCKVGDTVYQTDGVRIYELEIFDVSLRKGQPYYETESIDFDNDAIGKSIFFTREEAERKLIK